MSLNTLSFYNNEPSKNKHFLILLSSLASNSQEPKLKRIFEILWVLSEKSLSLYFDWPKSWIWRTLEKVMNIFSKWHFHNASKEVFWAKKNSSMASKVPFWQFFHSAKWHFWTLWIWALWPPAVIPTLDVKSIYWKECL